MPTSRTLRTQYHIKDISLIIPFLFFLYLLLHHHRSSSTLPSFHTTTLIGNSSSTTTTPTTLRHILFSIASSSDTFPKRNDYIRLWYKPNSTRAYLFLDRPTPISSLSTTTTTLPPTLIYGNASKFPYTFQGGQHYAIRIARIVKQAVEQNDSAVRWFVFGDDDTVFFTENLVQTLAKYDHDRWFYVGTNSERYELNEYFSFEMGFGGAGFAISHSLARVLARVLDSCLMRYPHLYSSDARVFSCLAELGVELTHESGFHQVDLLGNLFGMLSSLPLSPLVSLHHLDLVDPIFPNMTRTQALEHLFEVSNVDPARILQQTVCYDPLNSFTVSVAWGYAVQVFEGNHLLPDLLSVEETFKSWEKKGEDLNSETHLNKTSSQYFEMCINRISLKRGRDDIIYVGTAPRGVDPASSQVFDQGRIPTTAGRPTGREQGADLNYMFKTREQHEDPCKRPAVFYFKSVVSGANNRVWTYYIRHNTVGNCSQITVRKRFEEIRVFSKILDIGIGQVKALRRQCCDIIPSYNKLMSIGIRQCRDDELIAMPV